MDVAGKVARGPFFFWDFPFASLHPVRRSIRIIRRNPSPIPHVRGGERKENTRPEKNRTNPSRSAGFSFMGADNLPRNPAAGASVEPIANPSWRAFAAALGCE
jgi:hypothetical protein